MDMKSGIHSSAALFCQAAPSRLAGAAAAVARKRATIVAVFLKAA
jgi:hypothetical protein